MHLVGPEIGILNQARIYRWSRDLGPCQFSAEWRVRELRWVPNDGLDTRATPTREHYQIVFV
jgi:hypothetical protein